MNEGMGDWTGEGKRGYGGDDVRSLDDEEGMNEGMGDWTGDDKRGYGGDDVRNLDDVGSLGELLRIWAVDLRSSTLIILIVAQQDRF